MATLMLDPCGETDMLKVALAADADLADSAKRPHDGIEAIR
jgi:hypothetical protein